MVARCSIDYSGRLETHLAEATRLLMFKADGTFMVWSDHGSQSVKPLNWMTPPTAIEEIGTPPAPPAGSSCASTPGPARTGWRSSCTRSCPT